MNKQLKSCLIISTLLILITSGCSWNKPESSSQPPKSGSTAPNPAPNGAEDDEHINITKNHIIFTVTKKPKYFSKNLIVPEAGKVVAGLFVSFTNNNQNDLHIDPNFVEITTSDGQKHRFSATKTQITGKGAFKTVDIPPTYRGGGLVLFEFKENLQVANVKYDDQKGNAFEAVLLEGDRKL